MQSGKSASGSKPAYGRPTLAKRPTPAGDAAPRPTLAKRPPREKSSEGSVRSEASAPLSRETLDPNALAPQTSPSPPKAEEGVLIARRGPLLSVETLGPRTITVGRESKYEVTMVNAGDVGAEGLVVFVNLPGWAEVIGAEASTGATQTAPPGHSTGPFQWKVGQLVAKSREKLVLRIIPRESRPFDLAVRWEHKSVASQALIEVQEPKLEMRLDGPREVLYGKSETYRLKLANVGNGKAEGVKIKLLPISTGEDVPAIYCLGVLPAGEDKTIEVELTARQAGMLAIQVEARGTSGVHAELSEKVLVRRAGLAVKVDGPRLQYVGATAVYAVRVRNTGNAPAKNLVFQANLPGGTQYAGGIDDAQVNASGGNVQWRLPTLHPDVGQTFLLKGILGAAGANRLEISATADDDLTALAETTTKVEAVASLELDVQDPAGPVPVGEEATYEVRVCNRGTKDAEQVEVIGYFSRGVEPTRCEGGTSQISPGKVLFAPIPALAPGEKLMLKIHAKADMPGNHIFRAEVHCKTLGSRLINEENTLYYQEATAGEAPPVDNPDRSITTKYAPPQQ